MRDAAFRMGSDIRIAPQGDGGLYVAIPDGEDTLLAALDDQLRVRSGWPLLIEGRVGCEIAADVDDGSVRAVCGDDLLGFDRDGRPLDGWPVRLPQGVYPWAEPKVMGSSLYLVAETWDKARASATAWLIRVLHEGTVETGKAVTTKESTSEYAIHLGPDGTGYLSDYWISGSIANSSGTTVSAFDLDGVRPGWPIEFDQLSLSHPGFGRDGRVYFVQGASDRQGMSDRPSRLRSEDRRGRTRWTVELPIAASPEWNGASSIDVPAPPATGSQGTAFVVTELKDRERTAVYAVDPSGKLTWGLNLNVGLAWAGFCAPCSTGCGQMRVVPVVGGDGALYIAQEDGRVTAVGPKGRTQRGWPVTLRRPGASFWSLATDAGGTVFTLAIEPEPGAGDPNWPHCEILPASATILAIEPDGSVRARVTVVEP